MKGSASFSSPPHSPVKYNTWQKLNAAGTSHGTPRDSKNCGGIFDIDSKRQALAADEERMASPGFWERQETAQATVQRVKQLRGWVDPFDALAARVTSAVEMDALLAESPDEDMETELDSDITAIESDLDAFELRSLMRGPDDFRDAQVEISAGAGGTEAQDWASMLVRMYRRWAERSLQILRHPPNRRANRQCYGLCLPDR